MIRKAIESDIEAILNITTDCAEDMTHRGIFQWNNHYPNKLVFEMDLARDELFVLEQSNTLIGCITISNIMDKEYHSIKWLTENSNNLYIHRLAVKPSLQGKGFAQMLMSFAENLAIKNNYTSIRLDTFSQNKRNQKFYELRAYKRLGNVYFPKQSEYPFYCYELVL